MTAPAGSAVLSAGDLIHGAWYALEQCGILLNDACTLLEQGSHATAAGVAMLAREELGRHRMLLDFWREAAASGVSPTVKRLRHELEKRPRVHLEKQSRGGGSVTYRVDRDDDDEAAILIRELLRLEPGTPEYGAVDAQLHRLDERRLQEQPAERHDLRTRAFYVDVTEDAERWKRPRLLDHEDCAIASCCPKPTETTR